MAVVIGGDEVVTDQEREGEHAAHLYVVCVLAEGPELRAQVVHPSLSTWRSARDGKIAREPVPDG